MHRRDFLKLSAGVAGTMALLPNGAMSAVPDGDKLSTRRLLFEMNRNWRFSPQRFEDAGRRDFDDSHFERIDFPHASRIISTDSATTYRRKFKLPPGAHGSRVLVDFRGLPCRWLTAWINGQSVLGLRRGMYSTGYLHPDSFDLTPHLDRAGENIFVVELVGPPWRSFQQEFFRVSEAALKLTPSPCVEIIGAMTCGDKFPLEVCLGVDVQGAQTTLLTLETEVRSGNRVIALVRKTLEPQAKISGLAWIRLTRTDFQAGEPLNFDAEPRPYTLISRLKSGDEIVDQDRSTLLRSLCWDWETSGSII